MSIKEIPTVQEAKKAELDKLSEVCIKEWKKKLDFRLGHEGIDHGQTKRFHVGPTFYPYNAEAVSHAKLEFISCLTKEGWQDVTIEFEPGSVYEYKYRKTWAQKLFLNKPTVSRTEYKNVYVQITRPFSHS